MVAKETEQQLTFSDLHFPTQYHRLGRFYTEPGTQIHTLYSPRFDDTGHYDLVESGTINIYDEIQSHADSVDINILLKRYAEGDVEALSRRQAAFMDVTDMPSTYAEVLNTLIDAENVFMSLPVEERAKYDHSFQVWLSSLDFGNSAENSADNPLAAPSDQPAAPSDQPAAQ